MSHLQTNERTYIKDRDMFGRKERAFLGLSESAVVIADDGTLLGYAGDTAKADLFKTDTATNGFGLSEPLPTDFRTEGIAVLTALSIPQEIQSNMFTHFMGDFTQEQRATYVAQYDALDKSNPAAIESFVQSMIALLNY